jgi:2-hydroxychromene-2-carboxylate isomerase
MRGAIAAEMDGIFVRCVEAVLKMDDPEVIRASLDASGLDGARMLERIQEPTVKERLLRNTEQSVTRSTFGAPTFFVGGHIFFGKDRLGEAEEEIIRAGTLRA